VVATTSGTVSQTVFRTIKIIEHAFRRCKVAPEEVTAQHLEVAKDCLYLKLSNMANRGIPLWTIERDIIPLYQGQYQFDCPTGTVDTLNLNIRDIQRVTGIYSASEGNADSAFDGDVSTACTQTTPGGTITATFSDDTNLTILGILFNSSGTFNFIVETSTDSLNWNPIYTNAAYIATQGEWLWVDLDNPTSTLASSYQNGVTYCRLRAVTPTILNIDELVLANTPREIPMAPINKDDYANLPDHTFQGRPVQYWYNRQLSPPQMWIWPAADAASVFRQLILYRHRHIQDVGTLNQLLEIPQRWYDAIIWDLAMLLCDEIKEVSPDRKTQIQPDADKAINGAWNEETDRAPTYLRVNISPYTR
jgi:hypothetical protein